MPFTSRSYVNRYIPSNRFPAGLKWLLIANVGIFVLEFILRASPVEAIFLNLGLVPAQVVQTYAIWQIVTYMFLHASISHVLWNMLALWLFGIALERTWGTRRFLRFYFICGIVAGLTVIVAAYLFGSPYVRTLGSSGAVYGVLVAYGVTFPDQTILFGFLIPMKSKYAVMIMCAIVFLLSYNELAHGGGSGVAVFAHLGGLVCGYLLLRGKRLRTQLANPVAASYNHWRLQRAKKKFEVYLRKQDRDRWTH